MIKNAFSLSVLFFLVTACTNISNLGIGGLNSANQSNVNSAGVAYTQVLKQVSVVNQTVSSGNQSPGLEISLAVDTSATTYQPLTQFCGTGGSNPCDCQLQWTELNTAGGITQSVPRTKKIVVGTVQSGVVKCVIPSTDTTWSEIPAGTTIQMDIVPETANISGINVKAIGYKKGTSVTANGDFLDDTLTPFLNIMHYSCLYKRNTSYEILNQYTSSTSGASTTTVNIGSRFCTGVSAANCATPRNGYSAQSYYRNLYIQSNQTGNINSTNSNYDCPRVVEGINYNAGQSIPSSATGNYWPLDTTYALASTYTSDWSVGVSSGTRLYKSGDPNSVSDGCVNEDTSKRLLERGIVINCLGYAKKPAVDGTCGSITDSNGRVRPLTRLRRFRTIYPTTYQADGNVTAQMTEADQIYVADRLVVNAQGVPNGDMIYGPKPCNYSWFDHEGVVNRDGVYDFGSKIPGDAANFARPAYVATSQYQYNGTGGTWSVNPDGAIFPNMDHDGSLGTINNPSCSATLPVVEVSMGSPSLMRLLTINRARNDSITIGTRSISLHEVHMQPVDPWTPNYLEDTSFQACVPLASDDKYVEPPMHFYQADANTMAWCTKAYPTQNPFWLNLNSKIVQNPALGTTIAVKAVNYPGAAPAVTPFAPVKIYTSHNNQITAPPAAGHFLDSTNVNQSCLGTQEDQICTMTLGASDPNFTSCKNYLKTNGLAFDGMGSYLRKTCDRTVLFNSTIAYTGFPLQANDADVALMLKNDLNTNKNYSCQYSVSKDSSKVNSKIPSSGCCGMYSGSAILSPILSYTNGGLYGGDGHLEPFLNPAFPNVRFCGNPVQ